MRKILAAVAMVFLAAGIAQAQQGRGVWRCHCLYLLIYIH